MVKDSKKKDEKPKEAQFKKFLKKRAPFYLVAIALVIAFAIPELTKSDLQDKLPQNLSKEDSLVLKTLMDYNGPNEKGLRVIDAISDQINEKYPNERIYDNAKTNVNVSIKKIDEQKYQIIFDFDSYKDDFHYNWEINMNSREITGMDENSRYIINLVDFYD